VFEGHMECITLLQQLIRFDHFCSFVRKKTRLYSLANANDSEIFENNGEIRD